ncbi:MAG: MFS transporter [Firmicutes bacterium]|nr:MFS transporter [Alicyclobacillaceae bacterium]MCL6496043.1 MFS transporter [Bacillota bacterium]
MTPEVWSLLLTFSGAQAANAVASVFLNLFVFVVSGQLGGLVAFDAAYFFSLTFVFYAAAAWFRNRPPLAPYRGGLVLTIAFYAVILGLNRGASHYVALLGLLYGVAQGVYWFGVNLMSFDTVPRDHRIAFYGYSGAIQSVTRVVGPGLGGLLTGLLPGLGGYLVVFGLGMVLYAGALAASLRVPLGPPMRTGGAAESLRLYRTRPDWRLAFHTIAVRGTREGIAGIAGVYLVYLATGAGWAVGAYAALTALAQMVSSLAVTRWTTVERRAASILAGSVGMTVGASLLLVGASWPWVFAYGAVSALAMPFYTIPNAAVPLDVMDRDPAIADHRVSYTLSREVALNVGRLASIGLLAAGAGALGGPLALAALLVGTSAAQAWIAQAVRRLAVDFST